MLADLLDLFFPSLCYGCGDYSRAEAPLCWKCIDRLEPLGAIDSEPLSPVGWGHRPIEIFCGWRFDRHGPLARVIHALKYDNQPWLGATLGRALASSIRRDGSMAPGVVVPVPLHRLKLLERGYNQSAWIGQSLADQFKVEFRHQGLERSRPTETQTLLSRPERWANLQGAFCASEDLRLAHVLVVDDVITTGATIHAAADALFRAGVATVEAAAVCLSSG